MVKRIQWKYVFGLMFGVSLWRFQKIEVLEDNCLSGGVVKSEGDVQ